MGKLFAIIILGLGLSFASPVVAQIKIGILIPETGPGGLFGPSSRRAAEMAASEINAAGGINGEPVELMFADVGVPPAQAAQSALRLWRAKGVQGFVGMHDSAVREALIGQFKGKIPYVYSGVYEGGECEPGVFLTAETPLQQLGPVIPYIAEKDGVKNWYLIGNDYNWPRDTNAIAKEIIAATGGAVVGEEYLPFGTTEFDSSLLRIRSSGADAILITLVGGDSVGFNVSFAAFGVDEQAIRLGTLIEENTLAGIGAANADRLYASMGYFSTLDTPEAKSFAERYSEGMGDNAPLLNGLGQSTYDGLKLLAALANKAGSMDVATIEAAADGVEFASPRGIVSLTQDKHVTQNIYLADGSGGTFNVIKSFESVSPGNNCSN